MRELTPAEYQVALAMFALPGASERDRIRRAGLPSSTYQVARRRILGEGWLREVVLPNPGPCGFSVEFRLARPTLAERPRIETEWASDADCVLLWIGLHAAFGVFFHATSAPSTPAADEPPAFAVRVGRRSGSVPCYFDYSGLWARFGGDARPEGYPEGLATRATAPDARTLAAAERFLAGTSNAREEPMEFARLVGRGTEGTGTDPASILQPRTVFAPAPIPALQGRRITEVLFVRGSLRPGVPGAHLLSRLTSECRVFPFLFAEADGSVILAGMGQTDARRPGRTAVRSAAASVSSVVGEALDPAEALIEPMDALTERIGHRYPRRIPARGAAVPGAIVD